MSDEPQDFSIEDDKLTYRAQVSIPYDTKALTSEFVDKAIVGAQKSGSMFLRDEKSILIEDSAHDSSAYAHKKTAGQWVIDLEIGDEESAQVILGRASGVQNVKEAAAHHLAVSVTDIGSMLKHAGIVDLKEADIVHINVGETDRVIEVNAESDVGGLTSQFMVFEATIDMPQEWGLYYDRFRDGAVVKEAQGTVTVGDTVSGKIRADEQDNGSWVAIGQGDVDYRRVFKGEEADTDHIAVQLSQDLASYELGDDAIINHIRRHQVTSEEIDSVELGDRVYHRNEGGEFELDM
ncbi:MAG: hypothetical protein COA45_08510 [Zetaproteobacteria bacterium]|nr:MAG: hypothetical protein COA45_08510 [Zetaproteobacteria bacterium]